MGLEVAALSTRGGGKSLHVPFLCVRLPFCVHRPLAAVVGPWTSKSLSRVLVHSATRGAGKRSSSVSGHARGTRYWTTTCVAALSAHLPLLHSRIQGL